MTSNRSNVLSVGQESKKIETMRPSKMVVGSGSATGNPRNKVALKPGHSLMDWVRLGNSGVDLTGVGGVLRDVTPEQLAQHGKKRDAWIAIRGRVYNVTRYMDFHPGGDDELMRGIGQDGTALFNQIHPWVNYETLLQKCLVGRLVRTSSSSEPTKTNKASSIIGKLFTRRTPQDKSVIMNWFQQIGTVTLQFFTKGEFPQTQVTLSENSRELVVSIKLGSFQHTTHLCLEDSVQWPCRLCTNYDTGAVELCLTKENPAMWKGLGETQEGEPTSEVFDCLEVVRVSTVTHNTRLITLRNQRRTVNTYPVGHSVQVCANINGVDVVRRYTPVTTRLSLGKESGDCIHLMVKQYPEGLMSSHLCALEAGSVVNVARPEGSVQMSSLDDRTELCLLAAGTGFTPMVNIILWALGAGKRKRFQKVSLLFFNMTKGDILWEDELDRLAASDKRFSVRHVLTMPAEDWTGATGHLTLDMLQSSLPDNKKTSCFVFVCGTTPFRECATRFLGELGYPQNLYYVFQG